ncbi:ABC transporter ATP-binding protein [Kaistia dalseonensis]|uniref:Iron(III) transport system ATP-binding protein n=1 Tax=Kaistia dalseonensis TaxID=410840 RepID=A0ABU0H133_9HYPH|nr:ABC transporter ATP-binding protein [Kaistia dalseonensis]MCX5493465.1 ABC transporter ATP-binding protein [Kaistia dalseonensis]MDQ0436024.1 iron(III) transport system ATP-binding protein [Kaistia dalseonensis]
MTTITIEQLGKRFGETAALADVSLRLDTGSFTALLGPSGCGKTTLLRMIAGFEAPDSGRIAFDGATVCDSTQQIPPEKRRVGVVFQSYALWPHLTVGDNVAYPLRAHGVPRAEIGRRVQEVLALVGLARFGERRPDELSGGQRQRVALARCLVADHRIILFDEPLANLDMHLRAEMIEMIRTIHRKTERTMVYVTHDQAEALALADRVAVMQGGRLMQFGAPHDVYRAPANAHVAGFIGRGSIVTGSRDEQGTVRIGEVIVPVRSATPHAAGPVRVLVRPEAVQPAAAGLTVRVRRSTYRGASHEIEAELKDGGTILFDQVTPLDEGGMVRLAIADGWIVPED